MVNPNFTSLHAFCPINFPIFRRINWNRDPQLLTYLVQYIFHECEFSQNKWQLQKCWNKLSLLLLATKIFSRRYIQRMTKWHNAIPDGLRHFDNTKEGGGKKLNAVVKIRSDWNFLLPTGKFFRGHSAPTESPMRRPGLSYNQIWLSVRPF